MSEENKKSIDSAVLRVQESFRKETRPRFEDTAEKRLALHIAVVEVDADNVIMAMQLADRKTYAVHELSSGELMGRLAEAATSGPPAICKRTACKRYGLACYKVVPDFSGLVHFHRRIIGTNKQFDQTYIAEHTRWAETYFIAPK